MTCEPDMGNDAANNPYRRPDIKVRTGATGQLLFDVGIMAPNSSKALDNGSPDTPDTAASLAETQKRQEYAPLLHDRDLAPSSFIPFIVEATGRIGPAGKRFLSDISLYPGIRAGTNLKTLISYYRKRIHGHILNGNAKCLEQANYQSVF